MPTLPPTAEIASWGDNDADAPKGPAPSFPKTHTASGEQMPTIGHIGRYALKYEIGSGGLGTVYAAHDPLLSRLIAIKTLNLEVPAEERESFNALFLNEARAAAGLSHPNIVTVFDAGVSEHNGENSAYIAMELLKGRDLRQLRQEGWRPTPAQAALIVRRVADALAYAHSKGVVHRDIKPANIFMVGRTQPRVLDFGIARVAHQHDASAGDVAAGSPYYMAPEQIRQQPVDRRADVFSLGVVLYELLTDQKPFRGGTLSEITQAVLEHRPPRADKVVPTVPAALAEIAERAMEKDPEHRYRSARSLSRELRHWLEENANADAPAVEPPVPRHSRRLLWINAVLAGLGLLGLGLWLGLKVNPVPEAVAITSPATSAEAPAGDAAGAAPAPAIPEPSPVPADPGVAQGGPQPALTAATLPATPAADMPPPAPPAETKAAAAPPAPAATVRPATQRTTRPREREARAAAATLPSGPAVVSLGTVRIAVTPSGQVEVDGTPVGTAPPLNELTLSEGRHQITVRHADFPPLTTTVDVVPGRTVTVRHRFGS